MTATATKTGFTDYIVKDISLAEFGRKELSLAETEMPGLVPGIHVLAIKKEDVDGRDKPGHDGLSMSRRSTQIATYTAPFSALTRSVFSQEKPPSFSGARPKWP